MGLNINNLKQNKNEILKAEIISLFSLLEKTFTEWWKERNFFASFSPFYSDIKRGIKSLLISFKNTTVNLTIKSNGTPTGGPIKCWSDFINANWRSWRNIKLNNNQKKFLQVLYGSCEGINSGIEKGSPSENNQISNFSDKPFLTNSFGTLKNTVSDKELNKLRELLFNGDLNKLDKNYKNNIYNKKILQKNISSILSDLSVNTSTWNIISTRIRICNLIKILYSAIPSDSRFPANDTSLFDQTYMATSLFKASLADFILRSNSNEIDITNFNHTKIKWSILGIQYDKLSLAEKGLKVASIKWYRDTVDKVDNKIKKIIELDYALGNEVYRDETGIYFVVGENIKGKKEGDFYKLHNDLKEIKEKIQQTFSNEFEGEIYPAIFLTEPSRGLMNLGHLVEKAKENFLKAEYPSDFKTKLKDDSEPSGICQVCKVRLAHKSEKENLICDVCDSRQQGRIKEWLNNLDGETIWIDELQDKNGRIALVTLKFELEKWLNGDMLNSLAVREEDFSAYKRNIAYLLDFIKKQVKQDEIRQLTLTTNDEENIRKFLKLFDEKGIQKPYKECFNKLKKNKSISNIDKDYRYLAERLLKTEKWLEHFTFWDNDTKKVWNNRKKNRKFTIDEYDANSAVKDHLYKIFAINFIVLQLYNLLLERSIGSKWEIFICKKLGDWDNSNNKPLKQKIDFENRKIYWDRLTNADIEFLSSLILQFLLRKNPSPARLRRIWEGTKEFFKELESRIIELSGISKERCKRLRWDNVEIEDGEYEDGDIVFWAHNKTVYLITSIEKVKNKNEFKLKKRDENNSPPIKLNNDSEITYKPYFTILSPTPISWQFIIPAENLQELIENIQKEYRKFFKYVYGKLPLHIGIIVQHYKKPLYVGIKALRKIRRDKVIWENLKMEVSGAELKARQRKVLTYQEPQEKNSQCEDFYSLYEKISGTGKYEFYLYPDNKVWLDTTQNSSDTDKFIIYPNTIDFEFLDTNARRNDIYYREGKRLLKIKNNRPYDLYNWQYFNNFKEYFFTDKKLFSKLQKIVSIIYSKLEDWGEEKESLKTFMLSAFINILELKDKRERDKFAETIGLSNFEELRNLNHKEFNKKLLIILDMFDFWHTMLKLEKAKQKEVQR